MAAMGNVCTAEDLFRQSGFSAPQAAARNEVILRYRPLIGSIVAAQVRRNAQIERDDLEQDLMLRALELLPSYNEYRGVTLGAFLQVNLRWYAAAFAERAQRRQNLNVEYDDNETVSIDDERGRRTVGSKKLPLRSMRGAESSLPLGPLGTDEAHILELYSEGLTQHEIAVVTGTNQVCICRTLKKIRDALNNSANKKLFSNARGCFYSSRMKRWMRFYFFIPMIEAMPAHPLYKRLDESRRQNRQRIARGLKG